MKVSSYFSTLVAVSTIIFIVLLGLYFVKMPVRIEGKIQSTSLSFVLKTPLSNYLRLNGERGAKLLKISGFERLKFPMSSEASENGSSRLIVRGLDSTATFFAPKNSSIFPIDFSAGERIEVEVVDGGAEFVVRVFDHKSPVSLSINGVTAMMKVAGSTFFLEKNGVETELREEDFQRQISIVTNGVLDAIPSEGNLELRFAVSKDAELFEENPTIVENLQFTTTTPGISKISSIRAGTLQITEPGRTIDVGVKQLLRFAENDALNIRDMRLTREGVTTVFEGSPNKMYVGLSGRNEMPSILEWLTKNQALILLINSYVLVITFLLSIRKLSRSEGEET